MAIYPYRFSSDPSLGPKTKEGKKRGATMACKTKKATKTTKKKTSKKKPC